MHTKHWNRLSLIVLCAGSYLSACEELIHRDDEDHAGHHSGGGDWETDAGLDDNDEHVVNPDAHVTLDQGELEGRFDSNHIYSFRAVPYAQPPVGDLRWDLPQKPTHWTGTRAAKDDPPRCAQRESSLYQSGSSDSEDCLYLNVWTPSLRPRRALPVMVWIHGGGHTNGSSTEPVPFANGGAYYDGAALAAKGVVVVSINYRLGVFGFFSPPSAAPSTPDCNCTNKDKSVDASAPVRNQGLWDQQFALEWVRDNIDHFGGDARNVTIFGQASGAVDVCLHMVARNSRGLFDQAIGQSGGCTTRMPEAQDVAYDTEQWIKQLDCEGDDPLKCLRRKSTKDLLKSVPINGGPFTPVVDGVFLTKQPRQLFHDGNVAPVPYLLGNTSDEGTIYAASYGTIDNEDAFHGVLTQNFPEASLEKLCELYPHDADSDNPFQSSLGHALGDARWICPTRDTAVFALDANLDVYMYDFELKGPAAGMGAAQGTEVGYVFGTSRAPSTEERLVSDRLQSYWTNFAKEGNPNGDKLFDWPRYQEKSDLRLKVTLDLSAVAGFRKDECTFWSGEYERSFSDYPW